jgi:hypothetical protein
MTTIERRVGRLVELRPRGAPDSKPSFGRVFALANELGPDAKVVVCIDAREADPISAGHIARIRTAQLAGRERIERIVTVVDDDLSRKLQVERIGEGVNEELYVIARSPQEAVQILTPLLNPAELARLKQFLAGS